MSSTLASVAEQVSPAANSVSLGRDAWRRLRRNRPAMFSLITLLVIGLSALFAPILPLQPPDDDNTRLQYEPPRLHPLFAKTFRFDWDAVRQTPKRLQQVSRQLAVAEQHLEEVKHEYDGKAGPEVEIASDMVRKKNRQLEDIRQRPYRDAGFPDLGRFSRWLVRVRYRAFGQWSLGPVAGRDEFGRDVLSRVCWGARISIIVGIVATLVSLLIGVTYGALAGYVGGWVDDIMMRIVDILYSIPFIFIVIFIITILSEDQVKARK